MVESGEHAVGRGDDGAAGDEGAAAEDGAVLAADQLRVVGVVGRRRQRQHAAPVDEGILRGNQFRGNLCPHGRQFSISYTLYLISQAWQP